MPNLTAIHPWSSDALMAKARLWSERMLSADADSADHALYSAITLELLARAALARFSPVLLADEKSWRNIAFAIGFSVNKTPPGSIGVREVIGRLAELDPEITQEIQNFSATHFNKRNGELHSGELAFDAYGSSVWLPKYYQAAQAFLKTAGFTVDEFFPDPDGVRQLIDSLSDKAAQKVREDIEAYKKVWLGKTEEERTKLTALAVTLATRRDGHRVVCPACNSPSIVVGTPTGAIKTYVGSDEIEQKQTHIPSSFECTACGLKIAGFSKLAAAGLGNAYTAKTYTAPSDFFGLYTEEDVDQRVDDAEQELKRSLYERDNNE